MELHGGSLTKSSRYTLKMFIMRNLIKKPWAYIPKIVGFI